MNKKNILLILIFILGFLVRFWNIEQSPPGFNRDEASIGYTAYSLITTGKDEYGMSWPVSFKSFGDWKLPFYIYLTIPFIKVFGLTDTAVRLPSLLLGSLTVLVAFLLAKELFKNTKIAYFTAFLFALSPWSIHLARNASESTVGIFLTALGVWLYLKSAKHKLLLLPSTLCLVLPLYTYHGNHIFSLLLYLGLVVFEWRTGRKKKNYWLSIAIFAFFALFIYSETLLIADKIKISGLFALNDPSLVYEKITTDRLQHNDSAQIFTNLWHNKAVFTAISVVQNYIKSFSPEFLFITGGGNTQHNIPDFGNLYLWSAPFLLLGFSYLLLGKNDNRYLILFWFLVAPLAASITKDAPHTNRMAPIIPVPEMLIAYGFLTVTNAISDNRKIIKGIFLSLMGFLFIINFSIWTDRYFIHFPQKRAAIWGEGYKKLVSLLSENNNFEAREIVMSRPEYSPYIYFLFYDRVDPVSFQNSVVRYDETAEGFQHVASFGNFAFRQIDWADDLAVPDKLYIDWSDQVPKGATKSGILITKDIMDKLAKNNKDVSNLAIGDLVISQKLADIKLQNNESMFTLIKTLKAY